MTAAALAIQRIHPRIAILLVLLLAVAAAAAVVIAAFHGVPMHGHDAMSFNGPHMSFN